MPGPITKNIISTLEHDKENFADLQKRFGGKEGLAAEIANRVKKTVGDESTSGLRQTNQEVAAIDQIISDLSKAQASKKNIERAVKKSGVEESEADRRLRILERIQKDPNEASKISQEIAEKIGLEKFSEKDKEEFKEIADGLKSIKSPIRLATQIHKLLDFKPSFKDESENEFNPDDNEFYVAPEEQPSETPSGLSNDEEPPKRSMNEELPKRSRDEELKRLMVDFGPYKEKIIDWLASKDPQGKNTEVQDAIKRIEIDGNDIDGVEKILKEKGISTERSDQLINGKPKSPLGNRVKSRKTNIPTESTVQETIDFYKMLIKEGKKPTQSRIQELREKLLNS